MNTTVQTTCPYCGVGCGISAKIDEAHHHLKISGDATHPANFGRLCSKGSALGETVELKGRLLQPKVYGCETSWTEALDLVADSFINTIQKYGADAVAIYGSGQLLTEDYYVANKLMKGFIGSGNMDTNSRLCMSSSVAGHKRAFGSDTVPGCYEDLELAEMIVLIGSNAAWCHPVSFQRIRAAKESNPKLKIVVIDPRRTVSCDIADLHLPLASGSDAALFNGLLHFLSGQGVLDQAYIKAHTEGFELALNAACIDIEQVADTCRLDKDDLHRFYEWFAGHEKVVSLYSQGINQSSSGTDKVNAIINCHLATGRIGKPGCGPFSLTGQPNAMGGREVGGLSHQLAAHMDFSSTDDIERVARFWGSDNIARKSGYPAVELFDAIYEGKVKAVWIMGTNPVVSLPNADKVKQALQRCEFVAVSDCIADTDTTVLAHVLLPAQGWSEKDGTVTNSERRISRQRALFKPAGGAKPDWWIITQVARRMGFEQAFHYQSPVEIFREHARLSGFENNGSRDFDISAFADIAGQDYERLQPIQWPVNQAYPKGRARLFDDGRFFTESGKAKFIAVTPRPPVNPPDQDYPLILNTGRLRDQWHTMTRTAIAAKLNQHKPEPFVEVHPDDARRYGLVTNSLASIESRWGTMLARVQVTDSQLPGSLFVPMHWTEQYAGRGRMGALVNAIVDPISNQPESKHTPVRIKTYQPAWQGFILSRRELGIDAPDYWVKIKGEQVYRYELAGMTLSENWQDWAKNNLCDNDGAAPQWQEYQDPGRGNYRAARIVNNQLESVVFIAAESALPERNWLAGLFEKTELEKTERKALLTGKPPVGQADVGTIVCACFNVGEKTILAAIREQGLKTHQEIGRCLKAGTNCGSCVPEIKALL
ncbi:MAG: molybdopterin-dependent oxidoreductase [Methylobacter tundripaludum]|uniref:Assimilatory nitrate reductase catalytic subunit n=1 Tax=Methylobacter tundripaludum TaxID=173365 RepID=A0A2S6H2R5_9GAMM|nr:nitrate reductase [Methylobacter tundripaludum]MCK9635693.1 molybdopterin-dependent oxidoreductase [Methylobacter tundripaludum]PPK71779.1 assimilatory nitrate reductase catalytic subunit [Methylobacter tundripaludum]